MALGEVGGDEGGGGGAQPYSTWHKDLGQLLLRRW